MNSKFDYDGAYDYLKKNLKKSRFEHSLRVRDIALELAERYGADLEKTEIAALFHDIKKHVSDEEARNKLIELGITDKFKLSRPNLTHGLIGAEFLRNEYGLEDEEIYLAIRNHTFGRVGMTLLEKIVYIADKIERGRSYDKRKEFEELAFKDIDRAFFEIYKDHLVYLLSLNIPIHPSILDIINDYIENNDVDRKQ